MKENEDGKGKVKSRNKDKESRGEGNFSIFKLKWNFLEGALLINTIPGIFIYKSAIFFSLYHQSVWTVDWWNTICKDKCMMCAINQFLLFFKNHIHY